MTASADAVRPWPPVARVTARSLMSAPPIAGRRGCAVGSDGTSVAGPLARGQCPECVPIGVTNRVSALAGEGKRSTLDRWGQQKGNVMEGVATVGRVSAARPGRRKVTPGWAVFALTLALLGAALALECV